VTAGTPRGRRRGPLRIGLTGGVASGKSLVASILRGLGAAVVDADQIAREVVAPGAPIVTLADLDHLWVRVYVPETDLGRVHWGQDVIVRTDTYPGKQYHGRVSFIASEAEFTPKSVQTEKERVTLVYRVKVDVENPNYELKPGMPADAIIQIKTRSSP
jgi:HlyD family secretion protein